MKFDIKEFYPSINEKLLDEALEFAKTYTDIDNNDKNIIKHAAKSILYSNGEIWKKKNETNQNSLFDITMGGFHGAEICELVGLYMLEGLNQIIPEQKVGLYRDDGLTAIPKQKRHHAENLKKKLHKYAEKIGLEINYRGPFDKNRFPRFRI